ncbi:MAG TPA: hypothetical protein VNO22_06290 [Planctomycetota bacterium]|jgi:hypothetical protein|nr:hypothetical protein [Planctomycetota bacterium]
MRSLSGPELALLVGLLTALSFLVQIALAKRRYEKRAAERRAQEAARRRAGGP